MTKNRCTVCGVPCDEDVRCNERGGLVCSTHKVVREWHKVVREWIDEQLRALEDLDTP